MLIRNDENIGKEMKDYLLYWWRYYVDLVLFDF